MFQNPFLNPLDHFQLWMEHAAQVLNVVPAAGMWPAADNDIASFLFHQVQNCR